MTSYTVLLVVALFRIVLDYGYINFVVEVFEYDGYILNIDPWRYLISWLVIGVCFLFLSRKKESNLIYIYFIVFLSVMLPLSSYFALGGGMAYSYWANIMAFIILIAFLPKTSNVIVDEHDSSGGNQLWRLFGTIFSISVLIYLLLYSGGNLVYDFEDVYDYRADNVGAFIGIGGYFVSWSMKVVTPFLFATALIEKRMSFIFFYGALILLYFFGTGHKSALMPFVLCIFLYIFLKNNRRNRDEIFNWISGGLLVVALVSILTYLYTDNLMLPSIFFRRVFFMPAYLNDAYFEMFSLNKFVYWSNGVLSAFITYPYSEDITSEVGAFVGRVGMGANTGFIASGFMQAGLFGIVLYIAIAMVVNYYASVAGTRLSPVLFNAVLIMPYLSLFSSSDLPTTLLTHGMALAILLLYVYSGYLGFKKLS